jgi:hypothetical protein
LFDESVYSTVLLYDRIVKDERRLPYTTAFLMFQRWTKGYPTRLHSWCFKDERKVTWHDCIPDVLKMNERLPDTTAFLMFQRWTKGYLTRLHSWCFKDAGVLQKKKNFNKNQIVIRLRTFQQTLIYIGSVVSNGFL